MCYQVLLQPIPARTPLINNLAAGNVKDMQRAADQVRSFRWMRTAPGHPNGNGVSFRYDFVNGCDSAGKLRVELSEREGQATPSHRRFFSGTALTHSRGVQSR